MNERAICRQSAFMLFCIIGFFLMQEVGDHSLQEGAQMIGQNIFYNPPYRAGMFCDPVKWF